MKALIVILILAVLILYVAYNVSEVVRSDPQRYPALAELGGVKTSFDLEYRVTSRNIRIRTVYYLNETGGHEALRDVVMPFSYRMTGQVGEFYSVSANSDNGEVTCELLVNGVVQERQTAGGAGRAGSVRCDGRYRLS